MQTLQTAFGTVIIGDQLTLFGELDKLISQVGSTSCPTIALTGGSTPKAYYQHCLQTHSLPPDIIANAHWFTSDERCVELTSQESNFGNADRQLLTPLNVSWQNKHPWPVELPPEKAASAFIDHWHPYTVHTKGFELCLLGMGDDCHTASLFPGSPLLRNASQQDFTAVEVPGKGWRLTITPHGLQHCNKIALTVCGNSKTQALKKVFHGDYNILEKPVQIMKELAEKVVWLIDNDAAADTF